jgi:Lactate dehydrogenase and related dehydrogenases
MKKSAILLNLGRGGIVNEADLAKALDEGLIAAAGLDVLEKEPIDPNNPLLHIKIKIDYL